FRLYHDIIDDPKILQLPAEIRWYYIGILAISSRQSGQNLGKTSPGVGQELAKSWPRVGQELRGTLPKLGDIALHLRLTRPRTQRVIRTLIQAGLIDQQFNGSPETTRLSVHGWNERQFRSDDVNERVKKHRCNVSRNVTETGRTRVRARSETETETETEGGREN